jgi:uncharacterized membrane protein YeiH
MNWIFKFMEILGTVAFAISGATEAMKKEMDLLGVIVMGLVTAIGGGIIRDIIIGKTPPDAFQNPQCAEIAIAVFLIAFVIGAVIAKRHHDEPHRIWNHVLLISDAIGLGVFTILGIRGTQEYLGSDNTALLLFVGVVTGVGGGLLRDIFATNIPHIFRKHIYATSSIAGAVCYLVLEHHGFPELAAIISVVLVVVLRMLAAHFEWNLPRVRLR